MQTTVSVRGQTSIPAEIRRKFNIKANSKLVWLDDGNLITVIPIPENAVRAARGMFKGKKLVESLLADRREEREREERKEKIKPETSPL